MDREANIAAKIILIIGILFFLVSFIRNAHSSYIANDYIETSAFFVDYLKTDDGMYRLNYSYTVNGKQYLYTTDYSISTIPDVGSEIKIKYNPLNPKETFSKFNLCVLFEIIGAFFIFIPLIVLLPEIGWLKDVIIFLFTGGFITSFLINGLYKGYFIFALAIFGLFFFGSIMDFISYIKFNEFHPIEDIKKEIIKSKKIKIAKKEAKINLSLEEKNFKIKKRKKIFTGIILFLVPLPLTVFLIIYLNLNELFSIILFIISTILLFVGFFMVCITITNGNSNDAQFFIVGKRVDCKKLKGASLREKIKMLHLVELICKIIIVASFPLIGFLIIEDCFGLYNNIENVGTIQIWLLGKYIYLIIMAFQFFDNRTFFKKHIIKFILLYLIILIIGFIVIISDSTNKVDSNQFYKIMEYNDFKVFNSSSESINSTLSLEAIKNDIIIKYYEFENIKETRNSFKKIKEYYQKKGNDWQGIIRGDDYWELDYDGFKYTWILVRNKNSIICGKINYKNKKILIDIIDSINNNYN